MKEFVVFIQKYWQYISVALVMILEVVLLLIKRKPKTVDDFMETVSEVLSKVPQMVYTAEQYPSNQRKDFCVSWSYRTIRKCLNRDLTDKEKEFIRSKVSDQVEAILLCPTKKGGLGREQTK